MQVTRADYMTQLLRLQLPGDPNHWGRLTAKVSVAQPCGYTLEMEADVRSEGKRAEVPIRYPLMDDGAWEQIEGPVSSRLSAMGVHTYTAQILNNGSPIVTETVEFDQDGLYANSTRGRLRHDFPPGFIECAPLRPVCIDHDEVPVTIRLKTERVPLCRVRMDVTARRGTEPLVEPVELDLTDEPQTVRFQHPGWERGEYWIRVQLVEDGKPWGPYMVRKFWKEVIGPDAKPEPPLRLGGSLQYMVDGWLFEEVKDIDFWPMSYDPDPDKPTVVKDRPWEFSIMGVRNLTYNDEEGLYKMEYTSSSQHYRSRGYGWHLLADDLASDEEDPPDEGRSMETGQFPHRRIKIGGHRRRLPAMQADYEELLKRLVDAGTLVQEFDILPYGYCYAILRDPRPAEMRNTDHVMLAVRGAKPSGRLPAPGEFDESEAQIFEIYQEDLDRPEYVCLATSRDGVDWEKPELGLVSFHGSTANNILTTVEEAIRQADPKDVTAAATLGIVPRRFSFRIYDPARDGPVDVDKVFMALIGNGRNPKVDFMWPDDFEASRDEMSFTPIIRSYYPMVYKGDDEYLFLRDEPIMYLGPGVDLMHSNETIRHQVERTDEPTHFWYFRPNTPGYPPQGAPWDNHQGPLRHLAVMWTDDGMNFRKRSCISPDEFDPLGMQFYNMGLIREISGGSEGRAVERRSPKPGVPVKGGEMYVAEIRCHPAVQQTQYPELIWSRDLLHWHRFTHNRAPLVKLGKEDGAYNWGMYFQSASYYPFKDAEGNDAWWLSNIVVSSRHNHNDVGRLFPSLEEVQAHRPNYSESPFFVDWETLWRRGDQRRCPLFTRIRPGRLAYAAPTGGQGEFTTHPIAFEGHDLLLNAHVEAGGSLRVEVQDENGRVVEGHGLEDADPFTGDEVDHRPSWRGRRLAGLSGRVVRFRMVMQNARLFALRLDAGS